MFLRIFVFLFPFLIVHKLSAQYSIERHARDSTRFRFCTTITDRVGTSTKTCNAFTTRDSAFQQVLFLADQKHAAYDADPWKQELNDLDTLLYRLSGKTYSDFLQDAMTNAFIGSWDIAFQAAAEIPADTISIAIAQDMTIKGGKIKGRLQVDPKSGVITLIGVLPEPLLLKRQKDGSLAGLSKSRTVKMYRST
jgi:hypothetical protein